VQIGDDQGAHARILAFAARGAAAGAAAGYDGRAEVLLEAGNPMATIMALARRTAHAISAS